MCVLKMNVYVLKMNMQITFAHMLGVNSLVKIHQQGVNSGW